MYNVVGTAWYVRNLKYININVVFLYKKKYAIPLEHGLVC